MIHQRFNQHPPDYFAKKVLSDRGIDMLPVDVREIAENRGIFIKDVVADSFEGCAIKVDQKAGILINSRYAYEQRKRFTIAHELGHIVLPYHLNQKYTCVSEDMIKYQVKDEEAEANQFAAELLMPSFNMEDDCSSLDVNMKTVEQLADKYNVSKSVAALRFVEFTYGICAVVFVKNGHIRSFKSSKSFLDDKLFVAFGSKVSPLSIAGKYFLKREALLTYPAKVLAGCWLSEKYKKMDFHVYEQSFEVEPGKLVISFIWTAEDYDEFLMQTQY